jgi:hypothetical protein
LGNLFKTSDVNFGVNLDADDLAILKRRVFADFGYPQVKVEIIDDQFMTIIHSAVEYINTYSPKYSEIWKYITPLDTDYYFDELDRDITSILDVYYTMDYHIMQGAPPQILFTDLATIRASQDATIMSEYVTQAAQYSLAKTVFGCRPSHYLIGPRTIRINPRPMMETMIILKITTDHDEDLGSLNEYEKNWLIKFCTARTARILGRIRSKFTGVTLPIGDLSSDGQALLTEGKDAEDKLVEELKTRHKFAESYILVG